MTDSLQIDIIVPVYNHAEHLGRCISSALAQTHSPKSVICVDDASPDPRVSEILESFARKDSRLRVVRLPVNRGICSAQNVAIKESQGDYIAFLDCDDWIDATALADVAREIGDKRPGYIFTDRIDEDEVSGTHVLRSYGGQPHLNGRRSHSENLLDHMVASHLKIVRRDLLETLGGFQEGTEGVQDWDIALRASEVASLVHVPMAPYHHRVHAAQNSSYDRVANMRKTNEVRRAAQKRRFAQEGTIGTKSFALEPLVRRLARVADPLISTLTTSDVLLAIDRTGTYHFCPQSRSCVRELVSNFSIEEVLLFGEGSLYVELLKDLWQVHPRPRIGYYLGEASGVLCGLDSLRWSNSYFDFVLAKSSAGQVAMIGYGHRELEVFVLESPNAAPEALEARIRMTGSSA